MTISSAALLFAAAFVAGAINSVAGGGSFLSFPALMFSGVPQINANTTNTFALWPGSLASVSAYRRELAVELAPGQDGRCPLIVASILGGTIGALVLLGTPQATFSRLLPFLLLFATLIFAFGSRVSAYLRARLSGSQADLRRLHALIWVLQFFTSVYGGFFGAGIGIIMLASLSLFGIGDINRMNALKTFLATLINGIAVVLFVLSGTIYWPQAILMTAGAILGGYGGAAYARRIDPRLIRALVIVIGSGLTIYFFTR